MSFLKAISKGIDTAIDRIGRVIGVGSLIIMLIIVFEVISRRIFNSPTIWATELLTMIFAAYVILVCAYGLQKGSFVCVDVVSSKYGPRLARIMMLITYIIFFIPFVGMILPTSFKFFWRSFSIGENNSTFWAPPIWPVKFALFFGLAMLFIQGISEMIKSVVWLVENWNTAGTDEKTKEAN